MQRIIPLEAGIVVELGMLRLNNKTPNITGATGSICSAPARIFDHAGAPVPVCPHVGGVALAEYVQHLSMFDYIAVNVSLDHGMVEIVDHLHEPFLDPVVIRDGRYMPLAQPGYSITMRPTMLAPYAFPDGLAWTGASTAMTLPLVNA